MTQRIDPFADLDDFKPKSSSLDPPRPVGQLDEVALAHNFPSRAPTKVKEADRTFRDRRYRTGRNQQINIKATAKTIERLIAIADRLALPNGAVLELALDAFDRKTESES